MRSLFVVVTLLAVACGYVGWQAKIVRVRKGWAENHLIALEGLHFQISVRAVNGPYLLLPVRLWLGDSAAVCIFVGFESAAEETKSLFPEAEIVLIYPFPDEPTR